MESINLDQVVADYSRNGFASIKGFLGRTEVETLKEEIHRLVEQEAGKSEIKQPFFHQVHGSSQHFLDSANSVEFFYEKLAYNFEAKEPTLPPLQSVAKIGHALHKHNSTFNQLTTSQKVRDVFRAVGHSEPTIIQSMVIFKNPKVGGEYTPHQDATFLSSDDPNALIGFWIALEEATEENGCLSFIPGSHKGKLERRWVRAQSKREDGMLLEWTSPPKEYDEDLFVPVPAQPGDLVIIHGLVVHRSARNTSSKRRLIYTFHAYDKAKSTYLSDGWCQDNGKGTFLTISIDSAT